jgi:ankyrin repeat protein
VIGYAVEEAFLPNVLGNIPAILAAPVVGAVDYRTVLWPNTNPFQDQILALCQRCDSPDALIELARQGADFSLKILNGYAYPLQVAVNYGQVEAVKYFAERGYDLKAKFNKNPLLFGAVTNGHLPMIEFLIQAGVDPNQKGEFGNTALHYIAGSIDTLDERDDKILAAARCLIANGANHGLRNSQKKTPLDLALDFGGTSYFALLQSIDAHPAT